jgi:hypothetical protein
MRTIFNILNIAALGLISIVIFIVYIMVVSWTWVSEKLQGKKSEECYYGPLN